MDFNSALAQATTQNTNYFGLGIQFKDDEQLFLMDSKSIGEVYRNADEVFPNLGEAYRNNLHRGFILRTNQLDNPIIIGSWSEVMGFLKKIIDEDTHTKSGKVSASITDKPSLSIESNPEIYKFVKDEIENPDATFFLHHLEIIYIPGEQAEGENSSYKIFAKLTVSADLINVVIPKLPFKIKKVGFSVNNFTQNSN